MIEPGHILISHPHWGEGRRVCFVTEHTQYSTVALEINRPSPLRFSDLAQQKGYTCREDQPVYAGGEYNRSALIMLHDSSWYSANTMTINRDWSISSDLHMLEKVTGGNTPQLYRYVIGITAWPPHSLTRELNSDRPTWIVLSDPSPSLVVAEPAQQYDLALSCVGERFWSQYI